MTARRGSLVGATWLIGLGVVFLVRDLMDWSWGQAWPLFLILLGIAGAISALINGIGRSNILWALTWPVAWIVIGVVLLASTTGTLAAGPAELIAEWWPWVLVILGVWFLIGAFVPGGRAVEALVVPLGDARQAKVDIRFGAGELAIHRAAPGALVDGSYLGGVRHRTLGPGHVELEQDLDGIPWLDKDSRWDVGLTGEVPLDLRLNVGAYRGLVDLSDLRLATLDLHTGASETRVRLPRAAGATAMTANAGAASLTIEVPDGVAARIRSRMALGSNQVDPSRFPRIGDVYQSLDYGTAANHVDIDVRGGVGSLRVVGCP
jgi:hypothetical protein